ncbi:MAG: AMP-binding protein [Anaerobacillus sp.]|uniref:AMP-binding protein n=1 Tax=Anaerobacillus sp. TaxID=1872506 RepID=UPI00391AA9D1
MSFEQTLPKLLIERAKNSPNSVALRQKKYGIWNEITWAEYLENVRTISLGLASVFDFKKEEKVAIIGDNRPHWLYSQLATQCLGGISVGIYQESFGDQLIYYLNNCDARIVVAEDQEQVDKLLEIINDIPKIEKIIYYNDKGMRRYTHEKLMYMKDLQEAGKKYGEQNPEFFSLNSERLVSNDVATISYTTGSTENPKGVMLTHNNLISAFSNLNEIDPINESDDYLSFLPLAWTSELVMSIVASLCSGLTINFPEKPTTVLTDMREIGPHTMIAPPRTYENMISRFQLRIEGASWLKKKVYNWASKYGLKVAEAKLTNKKISGLTKMMNFFGDFLVMSAIRDHLGLSRIKRAYTSGSILSEDALYFFHSIGVNLKQCYGATQTCGFAFVHRDDDLNIHSVGVALPNVDVKITENEEVFIKSQSGFAGYYNYNDDGHEKDGWVAAGDIGKLDENGHLYITEQIESVSQLENGQRIAPSQIEGKLKNSRFINEAVVYGKSKPYLVSMINIDMANVGRWAEKNQIVYTTYSDLSMKQEVIELIEKEVVAIMKKLPETMRVKKIVILNKELDADDHELTRTQRIRRGFIEEKYKMVFEGLYSSNSQLKYKTGTEIDVETNLQIIELEGTKEAA